MILLDKNKTSLAKPEVTKDEFEMETAPCGRRRDRIRHHRTERRSLS